MIKNYLKIAWRNLLKNKTFSLINITGLSVGMAVALLIGLWVRDELTFNRENPRYDRIVQVMQHQTFNGDVTSQVEVPYLMSQELREKYGSDFKYLAQGSWDNDQIFTFNNNAVSLHGSFNEPEFAEIIGLKMLKGTKAGLKEPEGVLISESAAKRLFGDAEPLDKIVRINNQHNLKVTGVYADMPYNSAFRDQHFVASWELFLTAQPWIREMENPWRSNFSRTYGQLADNADVDVVSAKIKDVRMNRVRPEERAHKPVVFLRPMSKWHLYADWSNGKNIGGRIQFVWLFGIIGIFVLLLACINFMNLSTARSEKRAKEVGIRKAVGSVRGQLVTQFFSESLLIAAISFVLALLLVQAGITLFNDVADKRVAIPFTSMGFWLVSLGFMLFTGLIAGSYPALYLSSFQPVKVLKGTFRAGRFAAVPRKVLVVVQFVVSVVLIIGTIVVFLQVRYAKDRPVAYSRDGLLYVDMKSPDAWKNAAVIRTELMATGAVKSAACSNSPVTSLNMVNNGYTWRGMQPGQLGNFGAVTVTQEYGKTIGWQIVAGRDFSREFNDSASMILNESAARFLGIENPLGEIMKVNGVPFTIIGIVKDIVMDSPYNPVFRTAFTINKDESNLMNIRINPGSSMTQALAAIEGVFKKFVPGLPFQYTFADADYAKKFDAEQRIGRLSSFFAILAIFISCLGLFGMATFMAEQRVKEIGVRKVLGASVFNLWGLMSKDFVVLVVIALIIAVPLAWYLMSQWLLRYDYRTEISGWVFVVTCLGAMAITLVTVGYQSIRAATANPVKSLRTD